MTFTVGFKNEDVNKECVYDTSATSAKNLFCKVRHFFKKDSHIRSASCSRKRVKTKQTRGRALMSKTNNVPNRHKKNYGFGRSCRFANKNICRAIFGSEKYATRKSHESRIKRFLKHESITDLRDISQDQLTSYYEVVAEQVADEEISQQYACNLISSLNIMLHYLSQHRYKFRQPSEILGRRNRKRKRAVNIEVDEIENLAERLRLDSEEDIALCLMLCRYCGLRLREALMLDFDEAISSYRECAQVKILRGTKGGRKADRFISPPCFLMEEIERFKGQTGWTCLIPPNCNLVQRKREIHRKLLPPHSEPVFAVDSGCSQWRYLMQFWVAPTRPICSARLCID